MHIEPVICFLIFVISWSGIQRWAGYHNGDRYSGPLVFAALYALATWQSPINAITALAVSFIIWRSIGWFSSIDMGKDQGTFQRDYGLFTLIAVPLAVIPAFVTGNWWYAMWIFIAVPLSYAAPMRLLPNTPKYKHIRIAEYISGAMIGVGAFFLVN